MRCLESDGTVLFIAIRGKTLNSGLTQDSMPYAKVLMIRGTYGSDKSPSVSHWREGWPVKLLGI